MPDWILLLRGINVGGRNLLPMADLRSDLQSLGCRNVKTYIQSGNVVFAASQHCAQQVVRQLPDLIQARNGFCPSLFLVRSTQLEATVRDNPFPQARLSPKSLHVFFCQRPAAHDAAERLTTLKKPSEHFVIAGCTLYLHAPEGIGRSKLAAGAEQALGVAATARNWTTVLRLWQMLNE